MSLNLGGISSSAVRRRGWSAVFGVCACVLRVPKAGICELAFLKYGSSPVVKYEVQQQDKKMLPNGFLLLIVSCE